MPEVSTYRLVLFNSLALRSTAVQTSTSTPLDNATSITLVTNDTLNQAGRGHFEIDNKAPGTFTIIGTTKAYGANSGYSVPNGADANVGPALRLRGGNIRFVFQADVAPASGIFFAELQITREAG